MRSMVITGREGAGTGLPGFFAPDILHWARPLIYLAQFSGAPTDAAGRFTQPIWPTLQGCKMSNTNTAFISQLVLPPAHRAWGLSPAFCLSTVALRGAWGRQDGIWWWLGVVAQNLAWLWHEDS